MHEKHYIIPTGRNRVCTQHNYMKQLNIHGINLRAESCSGHSHLPLRIQVHLMLQSLLQCLLIEYY